MKLKLTDCKSKRMNDFQDYNYLLTSPSEASNLEDPGGFEIGLGAERKESIMPWNECRVSL